ncbi:MAG: PAS domain S-box protein [Flavobacteriaceae bacterium]|nr:PAS domain S-box protein [Flavobacteriaceae bacterium]
MQLINHQIWRDNPDAMLMDLLKSDVNITITDILGRIIYVNDQFCELSGNSKDSLLGEVNALFKSDLHSDPVYKDLWQTIKNGHVWKGVLSDIAPEGRLIWLETIIMPIKNECGSIDKFVAFYVDVTQTTKNNFKIIEKDSNLRKIKASFPKVVLSINESGEILNINHGIKNFNVKEIIGNSLYLYINPIFREMVKNIVKLVFEEGKPSQYETMDYNREGSQTFFISQITPVMNKYGRVISATISTQEVDEIQGIEKELIDNEEKYRTLFQSINTGIIVVIDPDRNIIEWNKGAEQAFGYSEIEMLGKPLTKLIGTKSRKSHISILLKAVKMLDEQNTSPTIEMTGLKKNGTEFPVEFVLSKCHKGNKTYYCAMMLDISKRKSLEEKLQTKTKELEEVLYRSAHDLNEPFSSAKDLIDLLREEQLNDRVLGLIDMMETTIEKGKSLSENLIEASKISRKNKI